MREKSEPRTTIENRSENGAISGHIYYTELVRTSLDTSACKLKL